MSSNYATAAAASMLAAGGRFARQRLIRRGLIAAFISLSTFFGSVDTSSATEFRTLKITDGRFEQSVITASTGEPLILDIELFGSQGVTVSIPKLGIEPTAVPANPVRIGSVHDYSGDLVRARFALGALNPGTYEILCSCYGRPATAQLVVE